MRNCTQIRFDQIGNEIRQKKWYEVWQHRRNCICIFIQLLAVEAAELSSVDYLVEFRRIAFTLQEYWMRVLKNLEKQFNLTKNIVVLLLFLQVTTFSLESFKNYKILIILRMLRAKVKPPELK